MFWVILITQHQSMRKLLRYTYFAFLLLLAIPLIIIDLGFGKIIPYYLLLTYCALPYWYLKQLETDQGNQRRAKESNPHPERWHGFQDRLCTIACYPPIQSVGQESNLLVRICEPSPSHSDTDTFSGKQWTRTTCQKAQSVQQTVPMPYRFIFQFVWMTGFEPATPSFQSKCAT